MPNTTIHQMPGFPFLTDGGLETTLLFHEGVDLPYFAAFALLQDSARAELLHRYYCRYAELAVELGWGLILESPTWRASLDWGTKLGFDATGMADINKAAVECMHGIRSAFRRSGIPILVSGNLGPRGDGYCSALRMHSQTAKAYHAPQVRALAAAGADMVSAFTLNYIDEAIGVVLAAQDEMIPVVISFTVETDGRLPSGETLADAVDATDRATGSYADYYMINCAHPSHFAGRVDSMVLRERVLGVRANASKRSHAELDNCTELDRGNPLELADDYLALLAVLPNLRVFGGCCGTDHTHVREIAMSVAKADRG